MALDIQISIAQTQADFFELIRLREEVFVVEQGVPLEIELDDDDARSIHVVARVGREVVGTGRLAVNGATGKIGRMAVRRAHRGKGLGQSLMKKFLEIARQKALDRLILHAQEHAVGFYEKAGFQIDGAPFEEAGILHRRMARFVP